MKAVIFPKNKLNVAICNFYNGHDAVVCLNTDRLVDNHYAVAELEAFRNDLQLTSFLNPRGHLIGENSDYGATITKLKNTNRISFGIYYNTNAWISPISGEWETIPDYSATTWTSAGASVFTNAIEGQPKATRYPNHGKQMYDISNGAYGFDTDTGIIGTSKLSEHLLCEKWQIDTLKDFGADNLTAISYMNGANQMHPLMLPEFISARNSISNKYGQDDTDVSYVADRGTWINKRSNTRVWDSAGGASGDLTTWNLEIGYAREQINLAILNNGYYSDFVHWHSVYGKSLANHTLPFFNLFYSEIRAEIEGRNVWSAGNGEAGEYLFLKELVRKNCGIGSFEYSGKVYLFLEFFDKFSELEFENVSEKIAIEKITTPLSFEIDLTGTTLAGKDIVCVGAESIRNLGNNKFIINITISNLKESFYRLEISEGVANYYNSAKPMITRSGNTFTADIECKWVVWRKATSGGLETIVEVARDNVAKTSFTHTIESGYNYYIGAISKFNHSNLYQI